MRRYGNMLGVLMAGLALLLGAALMLRMAWNWTLPDLFGFGPILFRHVLGWVLLGLISAVLLAVCRHRESGRLFNWRG